MDGFKKRLNSSLRLRLSLTLVAVATIAAITTAAFAFFAAFHVARTAQDDALYQIAALVRDQQLALTNTYRLEDDDRDSVVLVRRLGVIPEGDSAPHAPEFPTTTANGLHTLHLKSGTFRTLVQTTPDGTRYAVAQTTAHRNKWAREAALRILLPFAFLILLLPLVITHVVRRLFRPIADAAARIDARSEHDLAPVSTRNLPLEVRPFAVAINGLLERVARSIAAQRRFITDAAHELRSPLAALSLQAERLGQCDLPPPARERLDTLRLGITRGGRLVNQLLALSRIQAQAGTPQRISLDAAAREVLEGLMPLAAAKRIDLGVAARGDVQVAANPLDLSTLLKNLIDNAIRYTPEGGHIDVAWEHTDLETTITVADSGPGIAPEDRARVFEPFYRVAGSRTVGSGLGLTIARAIAQRLHGAITLDWADPATHSGLRVRVALPADAPDRHAAKTNAVAA